MSIEISKRRDEIKKKLLKKRTVKVNDLAKEFNVSKETIRRDLYFFEKKNVANKIHGGATLKEEYKKMIDDIPPVEKRKLENAKEKRLIAKKAAEFVKDGDIIILDSGSTVWNIADFIKKKNNISVVTNSIDTAITLSRNKTISVFVLGGKLIGKSLGLVGPYGENEMKRFSGDYAFLGVSSISIENAYSSSDMYEAEMKKAMVKAGKTIVVVADHTKFKNRALISFADFLEVDILITSSLTDENIVKEIKEKDVEVITVQIDDKKIEKATKI